MQRIRRIAVANIRLFLEDANLFKHERFPAIHLDRHPPTEGGGEFTTRCIILIFGEFDNFLRKIDNGMFGKNTELCTS